MTRKRGAAQAQQGASSSRNKRGRKKPSTTTTRNNNDNDDDEDDDRSNLQELPNECLELIASQLDHDTLFKCSEVCKSWRDLILRPSGEAGSNPFGLTVWRRQAENLFMPSSTFFFASTSISITLRVRSSPPPPP